MATKTKSSKEVLANISRLEKENAEMRKSLIKWKDLPQDKAPTKAKKSGIRRGLESEKAMMAHLWERCRNMESGEYFWFKQLSKVGKWYGKELSDKQWESFLPIWNKYKDTKVTPKPTK